MLVNAINICEHTFSFSIEFQGAICQHIIFLGMKLDIYS